MSGVPFRGVSSGQDTRFTDKEKKLLKSMKFPKEYNLKVDVTKVNWEIMKEWTAQRVSQLLGMEDEVLIGYIHEQLGADKKDLDPKRLQIALTGFLEKNTSLFVKELWTLLSSACEQASGIPKKILDDKAEELRIKNEAQKAIQERLNAERAKKEAAAKEAAAARSKAGEKAANDSSQACKAQNGEARDRDRDRDRDRPRDSRGDRDRAGADRRDRPPDRPSNRDRDRDRARGREYDRRREPSPIRPTRGMRDDDRHRAYDRDTGYNRSPPRYDRGRDRVGLGRERSPVLKRARYGRSRSPGRRSSRSPARDTRRRSQERGVKDAQEGKRDLKDLHSTFAKAEAETVLPDKAEHLILPPQRVDTAFPKAPTDRDKGNRDTDVDMEEADPADSRKAKKDTKEKKDKKEKKEKKKHKKEKRDRKDHVGDAGSSDDEEQPSADDRKRIEEELRQKALQSARKAESSDD